MITNWGYTLDAESLPDMLSVADFNTFTGGQYTDSGRVEKEISAACAAIRNYCGWHLYPSKTCTMRTLSSDRRISRVGYDLLIQLPARVVTAITSITIGSASYVSYFCEQNGLLRVFNVPAMDRTEIVEIVYTAGLTADMLAPIQEMIAYRVTHAVAIPSGITSEASGGVSVTYNAGWINNSSAAGLMDTNREVLIPYKVQGVF